MGNSTSRSNKKDREKITKETDQSFRSLERKLGLPQLHHYKAKPLKKDSSPIR